MAYAKLPNCTDAYTTRRYFYDVTFKSRGTNDRVTFFAVLAESEQQAIRFSGLRLSSPRSWEVVEVKQVTVTIKPKG